MSAVLAAAAAAKPSADDTDSDDDKSLRGKSAFSFTVTAVAAQLKQTKAWVRSQEGRALRKLRRPWYEKKLKEHQDSLTN